MPPKRKQSKANWRKRGAEFEEATLTARQKRDQDVRTGGSFSGMADAELFSVTAGATSSAATAPRAGRTQERKALYTERNLAANPHVPIVSKELTRGAKERAPSHSMKMRKLRERAARRSAQPLKPGDPPPPPVYDLWGDSSATASAVSLRSQRGKAAQPEPDPLGRPAVQVPAAGASYNPSREAHQELLGRAVGHELERLRKQEVHRSGAFSGVPVPAEGVGINREDGEGKEEQGGEEQEGDGEGGEWHREREKLTLAKRKRLKRARELEKEQRAEAAERKRARQLGRVGALVSEIKKEEKGLAERQAAEAEAEAKRPRKLGKLKFDAGRPEVLLTEELPANLRTLPAVPPREGLMNDRFKSLQARNLIEPRRKASKNRTRKVNKVTKNSAKDTKYKSPHALKAGLKLPAWM